MARNLPRKKVRFKARFFVIIFFLIGLIFLLFHYKNTRDIEFVEKIPEDYMQKDLKILMKIIDDNYMNLQETLRYNNVDFLSADKSFKKLISTKAKDLKGNFSSVDARDTFNEILKNLYDENVSVIDKNEYNKISKSKLPISKDKNASLRYKDMEDYEIYYKYSPFQVEEFDDSIYIKIAEFTDYDLEKEAKIFKDILDKNKDKKNLLIDLRDNSSDNLSYAIKVVLNNINNKNASASFKIASNNEFILTKDLSDLNVKARTSPYKDSDIEIKDYDKNPNYLIDLSINLQASEIFYDKVFILQNKNTKNSADFICQVAKQTGFAKTVGENTAGYGFNLASYYHLLPYSSLIIKMPLGTGINPDGTINEDVGTSPDIKIEDNDNLVYNLLNSIK